MTTNMKKSTKFERIIRTRPPYDKRDSNPCKNYGIGSLRLFFILKGGKGAVQIVLGSKLYLVKQFMEWQMKGEKYPFNDGEECLSCWDVGYHSWKPIQDWQDKSNFMECDIAPKGKCWYDGSSLRGEVDKVVENYLEHGDEWIWKYLEKEYKSIFEEAGE